MVGLLQVDDFYYGGFYLFISYLKMVVNLSMLICNLWTFLFFAVSQKKHSESASLQQATILHFVGTRKSDFKPTLLLS